MIVRSALVCLALAAVVLSAPATAVRADVPSGSPVRGIRCDQMEGTAFHIHQHLAIFNHGKPVPIPEDVGRPLAGCFYWVHTHTPDGIIHIESPVLKDFTLADFLRCGVSRSRRRGSQPRLAAGRENVVWVNGSLYTGNPAKIDLANHTDVTIDVGPPAPKPAPFGGWGPL